MIKSIERTSTHTLSCKRQARKNGGIRHWVEDITIDIDIDIDGLVNFMGTRAVRTKKGESRLQDGLITARITARKVRDERIEP